MKKMFSFVLALSLLFLTDHRFVPFHIRKAESP